MSSTMTQADATASRSVPTERAIKKLVDLMMIGQRFHYQHAEGDHQFHTGFRPYASYRDLKIADATGGLVLAHIVRFHHPVTEKVHISHYHDTCFQMCFVLTGWETIQMKGREPITMRAGSTWIQPPREEHVALDYSDGCEVLEIILPADFETVNI